MIMDGLQELSGLPTPNSNDLEKFWKPLRNQGINGIKTDLRENEHLCAIAFVKRRFVRYFNNVNVSMVGNWKLKGWALKPGVPSVTYMAAIHWLEKALAQADAEKLIVFHDLARKLTDGYGEWETEIKCIKESWGDHTWKALDGNVFFRSLLENTKDYPPEHSQPVIRALADLNKSAQLEPVTPFYAVLMMDGDSLGKQMSHKDKQNAITKGLDKFTQQVLGKVYKHHGFLIYAGGDDVLAILPIEDAMPCAVELRKCYNDCFPDKNITTSLSGAIEYAHIKMPLTKILKDAHDLLDNVAKEGCGRDAIAVRGWKPGGNVIEWAQPWEVALEKFNNEEQIVIDRLAKELKSDDINRGQFSSKFFYKIRERFELLNSDKEHQKSILSTQEAIDLMAAEYISSGLCDQYFEGVKKLEHAKAIIEPLLKQCRPVYRDIKHCGLNPDDWPSDDNLNSDGALLVRFLAYKGVEK